MATARAAWAGAAALLCLACLGPPVEGLQYQHDELLWTKQNWQEYKLPFPWSAVLKERDAEATRQMQGPLQGFSSHSLNGPLAAADALAQRAADDAARGPGLQRPGLELSLLDEDARLAAAAGVAQCKACSVLARHLWHGLSAWVFARRQVPNQQRVAAYAEELCEYEVMTELLKGWVLLRARVQQTEDLPLSVEGQSQEFYMLGKRARQHATPAEIEAVRLACRKLLREDEAGKEKPQVLSHTSALLHKFFILVDRRLALGGGSQVGQEVDDGPAAQRACYDRHPQCELWRDKGECESNPKYMLGDEGADNGWCRAACGACSPPLPRELDLDSFSDADARYVLKLRSDLQAELQNEACAAAAPCKWAAGEGMQRLLAAARSGAAAGEAELLERAEFIGGPVLSAAQQLELALDHTRLKESRPMLSRPLDDALVSDTTRAAKRSGEAPEPPSTEASAALWSELGNRCLYLNTGWWMYEVCYMHHIKQFHLTDKHEVDWVISLGRFQPGASNWTAGNASLTGLYPHFTQVPFVSQSYASGNHCDLDPDEGGASHSILRRTELRLMCSPDADLHIIVAEPEQCLYAVELYVPRLCALPGFTPRLPEPLGSHIGWELAAAGRGARRAARRGATAAGGGGGGGEEAGEGVTGLDPAYALLEGEEEDEYADPDEEASSPGEGVTAEQSGSETAPAADSGGSAQPTEGDGGTHDEL